MTTVKATLNEERLSELKVVLDVEGAPETSHPNLPGSPTVQPRLVVVLIYPRDGGGWETGLVNVVGPRKYEGSGRLTKRDFDLGFVNPMEPDSGAPDWVREIALKWQDKLNEVQ